jgi:thioredoxin-like negative regulator of GroEL
MVELALEVPATLRIAASAGTVAPPASAPTAVPARRSSETAPPAPTPSGTAPFAPAPTDAHDESAGAVPTRTGASRVALLGASGPLTLEWLECCLARDPQDVQARLDLCTALLVAERFADAERVAREGLARDDGDGRLLLRLSEALAGLGRTEDALATALRAVRRHRSRKAVFHLTRIAALAHRFTPGDGPRLRKGLESRPGDPVFLHALGVFESLHGSPREGLRLLKLALHQERTPRWRRVVSREIARLRAEELAVANGPERLRARA